ncbi:MAG: hypothetical protein B7Z08_09255 [Sphingomonadales bacterium 32-68-7]|nr:MAG: hypothetical protein B7Z33_11890 [Sphingomonadales bacterium 12-68-11]OYX08484.1 MAG: hypothetical protein B7Z08_09255 [Sphingomonadales bacterium 32-68-7]
MALLALAGAFAIHALQSRRRARSGESGPGPLAPTDAEIAGRMRAIAARMGLPERVLPRATQPAGDGDFVWREGDRFRYQSLERGYPVADHAAASLDEILYLVFRDRAWMHAYLATRGSDEATREARVAERQRAMLAAADPAWGARA